MLISGTPLLAAQFLVLSCHGTALPKKHGHTRRRKRCQIRCSSKLALDVAGDIKLVSHWSAVAILSAALLRLARIQPDTIWRGRPGTMTQQRTVGASITRARLTQCTILPAKQIKKQRYYSRLMSPSSTWTESDHLLLPMRFRFQT